MNIEELFDQPYYIVDILPMQVPANSGGQYFKVEQYYLNNMGRFSHQYAEMLLKLNCYYDMEFSHDAEFWQLNPTPEKIVQMVKTCMSEEPTEFYLYITLAEKKVLLTIQHDATYMTIYNPSEGLLQLLRQLASAEGLFVWESINNDNKR